MSGSYDQVLANAAPTWAAAAAIVAAGGLLATRAFRQLRHALASAPTVAAVSILRPKDVGPDGVLVLNTDRRLSAYESGALRDLLCKTFRRAGWEQPPHYLVLEHGIAITETLRAQDAAPGSVLVMVVEQRITAEQAEVMARRTATVFERAGWEKPPELMIIEPGGFVTMVDRQSAWNLVAAAAREVETVG